MSKDPKDVIKEIVQLIGKVRAERLLIVNDVAPSTACKLVRGAYASAVGELLAEKIKRTRKAAEQVQAS